VYFDLLICRRFTATCFHIPGYPLKQRFLPSIKSSPVSLDLHLFPILLSLGTSFLVSYQRLDCVAVLRVGEYSRGASKSCTGSLRQDLLSLRRRELT
jgi:hypothetical protein